MTTEQNKQLNESQKWIVCVYLGLLFLLISSRFMYKITNSVTGALGWTTSQNGCPNVGGLILHTVVFLLLVRAVMLIPLPDV